MRFEKSCLGSERQLYLEPFFQVNFNRLIFGIFIALLVGIGLLAGSFFVQMHRDLTVMKAQESANQRRLAEAKRQLETRQAYLDRLRHDPALVERLIRQKLGYAKTQEFVFRFDEAQ